MKPSQHCGKQRQTSINMINTARSCINTVNRYKVTQGIIGTVGCKTALEKLHFQFPFAGFNAVLQQQNDQNCHQYRSQQ